MHNEVKVMKKYEKPEVDVTAVFTSDVFTESSNNGGPFDLEEEPFNN